MSEKAQVLESALERSVSPFSPLGGEKSRVPESSLE